MQVPFLCREDPLEEGMATHSSILAWRIPWTEEPGGLQPGGSKRVRHDWSDLARTHPCTGWGNWVSLQAELPRVSSQGLRKGPWWRGLVWGPRMAALGAGCLRGVQRACLLFSSPPPVLVGSSRVFSWCLGCKGAFWGWKGLKAYLSILSSTEMLQEVLGEKGKGSQQPPYPSQNSASIWVTHGDAIWKNVLLQKKNRAYLTIHTQKNPQMQHVI